MKRRLFLIYLVLFLVVQINAQVYTNKLVGEKNESYIDSLRSIGYPYALPILGAKAAARRFDLPYSAGHNSLGACNIFLVYKNPDL